MARINIRFNYSNGDSDTEEFEADGGLEYMILNRSEELVAEINYDLEEDADKVDFEDWEVISTELDYNDQRDYDDFDDLDAWGEYCENIDIHGEGYMLRSNDIGEFSFENEYRGCWSSEEEFAQEQVESCGDIPDHLKCYINWEEYARDIMMDYSSYEGNDGFHIFGNY